MAIVDGDDGFVKVYAKRDTAAAVKINVNNGYVVFFGEEYYYDTPWVDVYISMDTNSTIESGSSTILFGFVKKSGIIPSEDDQITTDHSDIEMYNLIVPFDSSAHRIAFDTARYENFGRELYYLPEKHFGTDGGLPWNELLDIFCKIEGELIFYPEQLMNDLYNVTEEYSFIL